MHAISTAQQVNCGVFGGATLKPTYKCIHALYINVCQILGTHIPSEYSLDRVSAMGFKKSVISGLDLPYQSPASNLFCLAILQGIIRSSGKLQACMAVRRLITLLTVPYVNNVHTSFYTAAH